MASDGKFSVWLDADMCKGTEGCSLCLAVCETKVLGVAESMNARGVHPAVVAAPDNCTGCGLCVLHCPDLAMWLERDAEAA